MWWLHHVFCPLPVLFIPILNHMSVMYPLFHNGKCGGYSMLLSTSMLFIPIPNPSNVMYPRIVVSEDAIAIWDPGPLDDHDLPKCLGNPCWQRWDREKIPRYCCAKRWDRERIPRYCCANHTPPCFTVRRRLSGF